MLLRVIVAIVLVGSLIVIQLSATPSVSVRPLMGLVLFIIVLTIGYQAALKRTSRLDILVFVQVVGDLLFETGLVAITGGVTSPFAVTYNFSILTACILLYRRFGFISAALASTLYILLVALQYLRLLPFAGPPLIWDPRDFYVIFLNVFAFFLVAFMGSYLAERLRKTSENLEARDSSYRSLQQFHQNVVESVPSGIVAANEEGVIFSANRSALDILSRGKADVVDKPLRTILGEAAGRLIARAAVNHTGQAHREEEVVATGDGRRIICGMSCCPLVDGEGRRSGWILVFQDITETRRLEGRMRRREHLALIGEMSAAMAHEIRNPLGSLSGSVQVLRESKALDEDERRLMEIVVREADRLNEIVSAFLAYARPKPPSLAPVDLGRVIEETVTLLRRSGAGDPSVSVVTEIAPDLLLSAADEGQLRQVFWNLAVNAVQAMPGGGTISIKARKSADGGPQCIGAEVAVEVSDTGTGIAPEALGKVFLPFFTTKEGGSGLGLAIVYRIIEAHHGRIELESRQGGGTTVRLHLPVAAGIEAPSGAPGIEGSRLR
ncbi:MAG: ATP-binding protein [Nitrospirota bacterium]